MNLIWVFGAALFAFGLWMGRNAKTGPQSTMGSALILLAVAMFIVLTVTQMIVDR